MGETYLERFFEILEDADNLIKGELAPPRTSEEDKLKAIFEKLTSKIQEGNNLLNRMEHSDIDER